MNTKIDALGVFGREWREMRAIEARTAARRPWANQWMADLYEALLPLQGLSRRKDPLLPDDDGGCPVVTLVHDVIAGDFVIVGQVATISYWLGEEVRWSDESKPRHIPVLVTSDMGGYIRRWQLEDPKVPLGCALGEEWTAIAPERLLEVIVQQCCISLAERYDPPVAVLAGCADTD